MDIKSYVQKLSPLFKRNGLSDAFDSTADSINQTVMPFYLNLQDTLPTGNSQLWKLADKMLRKDLNFSNGNWLQSVVVALRNVLAITPELGKRIDRTFSSNIAAEGLSYKEANLLQLATSLEFYASYARTLLRAIVIVEAAGGKDNVLRNYFTQNDITWITSGIAGFAQATKVLLQKPQDILNKLDAVPDVLINDVDGVGVGLYNAGSTDPLGQQAWSATDNPIHRLRIWLADRAAANLDAAKEEAKALEYHILALKQKQSDEGGEDPLTQKQIEYHENRLKKMRYDINRKEAEDA